MFTNHTDDLDLVAVANDFDGNDHRKNFFILNSSIEIVRTRYSLANFVLLTCVWRGCQLHNFCSAAELLEISLNVCAPTYLTASRIKVWLLIFPVSLQYI